MPGVPTGRACDACRKQKKKCDETQPSCSRCTRLNIPCVGSGQKRFKFKAELGFQQNQKKGRKPRSKASSETASEESVEVLPLAPSGNGAPFLARAFIETIRGTTDLRYNLGWSYGFYLYDIPRRLGTNEALDSSADALVTAHSSFCLQGFISVETLVKYSRALNVLRKYLDDPVKARTSDTLGAVALLLICQNLLANPGLRFTGHVEGAVQILKARRHLTPQDSFEEKILLTLRGPVLFEALFNDRISFSSEEWKDLIDVNSPGSTNGGQIFRCLGRVPDIMRRGKYLFEGDEGHAELRDETRFLYEKCKLHLEELRKPWAAAERPGPYTPLPAVRLHAHSQRLYALGLLIAIFINCVLSALDGEDDNLIMESTYFATEVLGVAEEAARYRPLGANYMNLCLMAAWAGTNDKGLRSLIEMALEDYHKDFFRISPMKDLPGELESMTHQMRLLTTGSPSPSTMSSGSSHTLS